MSISSESYGTKSRTDDLNNNADQHPALDNCLAVSNMPSQGPQWTEFLSCEVCYKLFSENANRPISLGCGHTVCKLCLSRLQQSKCPFDQSPINCDIDKLPVNYALLQLVGAAIPDKVIDDEVVGDVISDARKTECYESARKCIEELAVYLKPLSEDSLNELEKNHEDISDLKVNKSSHQPQLIHMRGGRTISTQPSHGAGCMLSRPMQRKLLVLINCQLVEEEGRSRAARAARSLGERTVTELILAHQNPQQLSANLWAAVRTRGCQFLGPGMQEEVLRLILLALEDGSALSRKVLVLFVVQRLEKQYPQASKTAIGHVVQLLYRASCFKVTKRDEESSLMQLKEEFRSYDTLRLEHDAQIVQIAMEAGLRISPEQWSSLLYGDTSHKSHMQSIIDKHQNPQSFTQGISELVLVLQRQGDPANLSRLRPHLEFLAKIDPSPDCPAPSWEDLEAVMKSLKMVVQGLVDFVKRYNHRRPEVTPPQNTRYKTSMCRDFVAKGSCPRGATCTFAHSQEELEQYRSRSKKLSQRGGGIFGPNGRLDGLDDLNLRKLVTKDKHKEKNDEEEDDEEEDDEEDEPEEVGQGNPLAGLVGPMAALAMNPAMLAQSGLVGLPPQPGLSEMGQGPGVGQQFPAVAPGGPMPGQAMPGQPPAPGTMFSVLQPGMGMPAPNAAGVQLPFGAPQEGMRTDVPQGMVPPPGLPRGLVEQLGVQYQGALTPGLVQQPMPSPTPPTILVGAPPPSGRPGDPAQPAIASMFPATIIGPGGVPVQLPPEAFNLPVTELQSAMPGVPMQSLEKLRNRKSELISHLQNECGAPGTFVRSQLEQVLATRPRPSVDPLSSSINNTFVAMRTTSTLDEFEHEARRSVLTDHHNGETYPGYSQLAGVGSVYASVLSNEQLGSASQLATQEGILQAATRAMHIASQHKAEGLKSSQADYAGYDLSEDGSGGDIDPEVIRIVQSTLHEELEDDHFIPFDPPLVSKYGPISRNSRMKSRDTAPVNVTAQETTTMTCNSVLSVTPMHRPYPTSALAPSIYDMTMAGHHMPLPAAVVAPPPQQPTAAATAAAAFYSPWNGLDFWRRQIPEMVQSLEKSAIQAHTTSERLALQLQSVELQISMGMLNSLAAAGSLLQKTGENPKPVSQLLQEASLDMDRINPSPQCLGGVYLTGNEALHVQPRLPFADWK